MNLMLELPNFPSFSLQVLCWVDSISWLVFSDTARGWVLDALLDLTILLLDLSYGLCHQLQNRKGKAAKM